MKRDFVILFIELFCVQASFFLEALLQEYVPHLPQDLPSCQTIA